MITLSELESEIKNMQIICPYCFKYEIMDNSKSEYLIYYIDILKIIYNENPKCSIKLNKNCLNTGSIWCTGCLNWICKNCSIGAHLCNYSSYVIKLIYNTYHPPKVYLTNRNPSHLCSLHNKPYSFYCDDHKFLCEECEDCDLSTYKMKREYSHGNCYFGPIANLQLQAKLKIIEEKIEKSIHFFNTYILKLYNDNKNNYKNGKRKRFNHNFKKYKKKFVSFLQFVLLLIKTSKKIMAFSFFAYEYINTYTFEYKKFEYDKNIKNKSLKNFKSQLSNYFASQFIPIKASDDEKNGDNVNLSKYNLKLILENFTPYDDNNSSLVKWKEIKVQEFDSLELLEFNKNYFIQFDNQDLKYKNILIEEFYLDEEYAYFNFSPMLKHQNKNIYLWVNEVLFCVLEEINKKKSNSKKKFYKIIYLKSLNDHLDKKLKEMKLITNNSLALIFNNGVIILSAFYPFSILKEIKFSRILDDIRIFFLSFNPDIFIIINNCLYLMQIYNKKNYELISYRKGLFGEEIIEINSNIIIITYLSKEENVYIMIVVNIHSLKVLNCISHSLSDDYAAKFKLVKNPNFYLYSNQIEYLAINYPKFLKNNYFKKNDVRVKYFKGTIRNVALLKNDILVLSNRDLIIVNKNIIIPNVEMFCLTDENNIIICLFLEYGKPNYLVKIKVIKLNENDYEIININTLMANSNIEYIEYIVKLDNNRFITNCEQNLALWKLNGNYTLEYLSKSLRAELLLENSFDTEIKDIFVLNKDMIIPKFRSSYLLHFWKINEDSTLTKVFNTNLNFKIKEFLKYDNVLFIYSYNSIILMNINNYQLIKQIENIKKICCMTKSLNGNIILGVGGNEGYEGYDIVECKFNKITYDLIKVKLIPNAHYSGISKIIEMKNGNIISFELYNNFIVIWNRKEDLK